MPLSYTDMACMGNESRLADCLRYNMTNTLVQSGGTEFRTAGVICTQGANEQISGYATVRRICVVLNTPGCSLSYGPRTNKFLI